MLFEYILRLMLKKSLILLFFVSSMLFGDIFKNSASLIFTLPTNKWQFDFDKPRYGVSSAGFLTGYRWTNSPVIIYCELIPTNYQFDLYTQLQKIRKTSQIKDATYQASKLVIDCLVPYEVTYWYVKDFVYEYVTYFSLNDTYIASIVISSKKNDVLMSYFDDYKTVLKNFAKIAGSFK